MSAFLSIIELVGKRKDILKDVYRNRYRPSPESGTSVSMIMARRYLLKIPPSDRDGDNILWFLSLENSFSLSLSLCV